MLSPLLALFVALRFAQYLFEKNLSRLNHVHYSDLNNQKTAQKALAISDEEMLKTLAYTEDKYKFGKFVGWLNTTVFLVFLAVGGLGYYEQWARGLAGANQDSQLVVGLIFFALLGATAMIYGIPFSYYSVFVIEERHGFNRQTRKGFVMDLLKGLLIGTILGGLLASVILLIMQATGETWWIWAWITMSTFSILTAWIYPTFLAPLFNKFAPLEEGELKEKIYDLAKKVSFQTNGLFVMDASKRSSHGNAYFTGVFGKKRIVLFDTLIEAMRPDEVVAVLAHELGHFKLHHVRWMLIRGVLMTGVTFYLLSLCLPLEQFYHAFGLQGVSTYGAVLVFSLWFGLIEFLLDPIETYLSRRNEFAADRFALEKIDDKKLLGSALLKLREKSHAMPICHPWYSKFYYSHPPMLERLKAMNYFV